jgi:hypothetical protein
VIAVTRGGIKLRKPLVLLPDPRGRTRDHARKLVPADPFGHRFTK